MAPVARVVRVARVAPVMLVTLERPGHDASFRIPPGGVAVKVEGEGAMAARVPARAVMGAPGGEVVVMRNRMYAYRPDYAVPCLWLSRGPRAHLGHRLGFGYLSNPGFAEKVSLPDPLSHQRIAVYEHVLKEQPLRSLSGR